MERSEKERIKEIESCIEIWKDNQWKHSTDEAFFHYSQGIIDELESKLDIITRAEN